MPIEFVDFETARNASGLRMVYVSGVPSPWGEAAKGILHVKGLSYTATRLDNSNADLAKWIGQASGPVAIYEDEAPLGGWAEILLLCERLAPKPALLPSDAGRRAVAMGLSHEICGQMGLGWCRRLEGVASGMEGTGGFPKPVAQYLGPKYGYRDGCGDEVRQRVIDLLKMLMAQLDSSAGGYFLGDTLTAVDLYSAAFMALFAPLPKEHCPMPETFRDAFASYSDEIRAALAPALLEHRDRIYRDHLELPLSL